MAVAGDFDYERGGRGYAALRRTDPRIAAVVHGALGAAGTVLNVGAGAGSYEPTDRYVVALEPSAAMRAQRHAVPSRPCTAWPNTCPSTTSPSTPPWPHSPSTSGRTCGPACGICGA